MTQQQQQQQQWQQRRSTVTFSPLFTADDQYALQRYRKEICVLMGPAY